MLPRVMAFSCMLLLMSSAAYAQTPSRIEQAAHARSILKWGGETGTALHDLLEAGERRRIPGDRYENLAREIIYSVNEGRAASALIRAPIDLAGSALQAVAYADPEPVSRMAATVLGEAAKKFGESMGQVVLDNAQAHANGLLRAVLDESKISIDDLQKMGDAQFSETITKFTLNGQRMEDLLESQPQMSGIINRHMQKLRDTNQLAILKNTVAIKGSVEELAATTGKISESVTQLSNEIERRLDATTEVLLGMNDALAAQSRDMQALKTSVEGNSAAIHSLAQVSSMSWTTDQKLAALEAGLFTDLSPAQTSAMRTALASQKKTESFVSKMQSTASVLGVASELAQKLGVDPNVVKVAQAGQVVVGALAAYAQGNYLGVATAASSLIGLGGSGSDPNAAIIAELSKINRKLELVIDLQQKTLDSVLSLSEQVREMQIQIDKIHRSVNIANMSLQYLLLKDWEPCSALANTMDNVRKVSFDTYLRIAKDPNIAGYLVECYDQYSSFLDAYASVGENSFAVLNIDIFPKSNSFTTPDEASLYVAEVTALKKAYGATRSFLTKVHGERMARHPATYLSALLDPKPNFGLAEARDQRRMAALEKLNNFKCRDGDTLHVGIVKSICQGVQDGDHPQAQTVLKTVSQELAGPYGAKLIDAGISIAAWSNFMYWDERRGKIYVTPGDLTNLAKIRISSNLAKTLSEKSSFRRKLIERLEWLASGIMLQQSIMHGDFTAQLVLEELYESNARAIIAPPPDSDPNDPKMLAFTAMQANDVLARNVVMLALKKSLTDSNGILQISAYTNGITALGRGPGCNTDLTGVISLKLLAPGWVFTRGETQESKSKNTDLALCMTSDAKQSLATGVGVRLGNLFVKAPLPNTLSTGEFERPAALRLIIKQFSDLANERADIYLEKLLQDKNSYPDDFVLDLLKSRCLSGQCS